MPRGKRLPDRPALTEATSARAIDAGMSNDCYNAAVRLQCAIRDAADRPVSMQGAIEALTECFNENGVQPSIRGFIQKRFDRMQEEAQRAHDEAERVSRANAGRG